MAFRLWQLPISEADKRLHYFVRSSEDKIVRTYCDRWVNPKHASIPTQAMRKCSCCLRRLERETAEGVLPRAAKTD